jgi:VWFA-related protein
VGRIAAPLALATAVLSAQSAPPTRTSQTPGQQPTFRATANFVSTDIRATDSRGNFVPDLTREEFRVFEDGVEQRVTYFQPVIGGRVIQTDVPGTASAPLLESLILPSARPPTDTAGRIFIIFIDDMHLQALDSGRVRQVLEQVRDELIHENDLVALVSTGYSSIATDLAYDYNHRRFNEAIGKVMGHGLTIKELIEAPTTAQGPTQVRYNAHVAFSTAYDMLEQLANVTNRRKSFIYVSNGYSFNPFTDSRFNLAKERYANLAGQEACPEDSDENDLSAGAQDLCENPFLRDGHQFSEADLIGELARLTRAARRANVVFYTLDPRGLIAYGGADLEYQLTPSEWRDWVQLTTSSLQLLGEETGGFCICSTNDFKTGLQRIDAETSDHYILGYNSNNPDPTHLRRRIEIRTTRPGVDLVYREEYILERPSER